MKLKPQGANQTELTFPDGSIVLFSYSTPVAAIIGGTAYRTDRYYSRTTSKHINQFLRRHGYTEARAVPQSTISALTGA